MPINDELRSLAARVEGTGGRRMLPGERTPAEEAELHRILAAAKRGDVEAGREFLQWLDWLGTGSVPAPLRPELVDVSEFKGRLWRAPSPNQQRDTLDRA